MGAGPGYLQGKLLVPLLGEQYGVVLESGGLELRFDETAGAFAVWAYEFHKLPIRPLDYNRILGQEHTDLERLGDAFAGLPSQRPNVVRRADELKAELAQIAAERPDVADAVAEAVASFNENPDRLDGLIRTQHWRAAFFQVAADDINYRRFFNINELAGLRMEQLRARMRSTDYIAISRAAAMARPQRPTDFLDKLDINNAIDEIENAAKDLEKFLKTFFTDPSKLASAGIVDLLKAMESLLLAMIDLAEDLIEAVLAIIKTILAGTLDVLEHSVDIPIIGTLFKFLTSEDMTLLNLGTLAVAVPLYILFFLVFDKLPFKQPKEDVAASGLWTEGQYWDALYLIVGEVYTLLSVIQDSMTIAATPEGNLGPEYKPLYYTAAIFSIVAALGMQITGWPDTDYFPHFASLSPLPTFAWVAIWFNFCLYFIQPLWGLPAMAVPILGGDVQNTLTTIVGAFAVLSGIVAAAEGSVEGLVNWEYATELAFDGLNMPFALFLLTPIRDSMWAASSGVVDTADLVLVADLLVNLSMPILNMFADGFSEAAAPADRS